jgi:hypothetical protein
MIVLGKGPQSFAQSELIPKLARLRRSYLQMIPRARHFSRNSRESPTLLAMLAHTWLS